MSKEIANEREKHLLELALSSKDLFIKVLGVMEPDRFEPPLSFVVEFTKTYFSKYHAIPDLSTIKIETGIELEQKSLEQHQFNYAVDEIELHCQKKAMYNSILASVDELKNAEDSQSEPDFGKIEKLIRDAITVSVDKDLGLNFFVDPASRLRAMMEGLDDRGIGWPAVDEMMNGVRRGELVIFAAISGGGKSVVLANIARMMAKQGLNTLLISLELSDKLIAKRLDSIVSGISSKQIFEKIEELDALYKTIGSRYGSLYIKKMSPKTRAIDIRAYLMEYKLQFGHNPDVIIVDYMGKMRPNSKSRNANKFDIDEDISDELRDLAIDYNAYMFSAAQFNRGADDIKEKKQSHIGGGLSKIQTADAVIAIKRTEENKDEGIVVFQPIKLRNAEMRIQDIVLYWDDKTLEISDKPNGKLNAPAPGSTRAIVAKSQAQPTDSAKKRLNDIINKTRK